MSERGFLSRWSQRKLEAEQKVEPVTTPFEVETEQLDQQVIVSEEVEQKEYVDEELVASLPDIETLDSESDFSGFMQKGVPQQLKKLALRKLWSSNPIFANLDGLNDYDEDFSQIVPLAEGVAEELKRLMEENRKDSQEEAELTEEEAKEMNPDEENEEKYINLADENKALEADNIEEIDKENTIDSIGYNSESKVANDNIN